MQNATKPVRQTLDSLSPKLIGRERFINIRDIIYMVMHKEKQPLSVYQQYLDKVKWQTFSALLVVPLSIVANVLMQRRFVFFQGKGLPQFLMDFAWYCGATYLSLTIAEMSAKEKKFQQIKTELINNRTPSYLYQMFENSAVYHIPVTEQLGTRQISATQLSLLNYKIENIVQEFNAMQAEKKRKQEESKNKV